MDSKVIIEAIGYIGSALVLVSFLMVSVVKLRIVNTIGSIIFTIYAFIIRSYPTAIMNLCLVGINIYYLLKMSTSKNKARVYDLVKVTPQDAMLQYTLNRERENILDCFPGISMNFSDADAAYMVCCKGAPAGIFLGRKKDVDSIDIFLDYSLPEYRDFSIGNFLFSKLAEEGIHSLIYSGPDMHHMDYLNRYNFIRTGDYYVKVL